MKHPAKNLPTWTTASVGAHADTSPLELSALGEHLDRCQTGRGPLFSLRCAADATHGLMAPRVVTTLVLLTALLAAATLLG